MVNQILVEYIWIDGSNGLRSKTRVCDIIPSFLEIDKYPKWNYDGSSTKQTDSEVVLKPVAVYPDPFRKINSVLLLCETYINGNPHITNKRNRANILFEKYKEMKPLFGIEQDFFITKDGIPIGFIKDINIKVKYHGDYYCGVGGDNIYGRDCIEEAFNNCLNIGLELTGLNAGVAPSQWEFQVCVEGIEAGDQLYIMRYILLRTVEKYGYSINFHPKPIEEWNGSGCHTNFSTKEMREENGYNIIMESITKLEKEHIKHMENYGLDNRKRISGLYETSNYNKFSYGVGDRTSSIRIPNTTFLNKKGYFEDRRPVSNMDPYIVTSLIFETSCL
jgi:glutamine synthetase